MSSIYEAMANVMADVDAIGKNQKNQQQGFKFRGIDDVYNTVHPIFAKHGVFTVPTVISEKTEERQTRNGGNLIYRILTMKYTFYATDGSSIEAVVIGEGMDSGDKGANKAMAIAHKYALLQTLCIPTEDMIDPDGEIPEQSTRKPERPEPRREETNRPRPNAPGKSPEFDPATAPTIQVVGMVKANMAAVKLNKGLFNAKRAWNQILELCSGDVDFAKGMFARFGADTSDKITYLIYEQVFEAIQNPSGKAEDGPESFVSDLLDVEAV